MFRSTVHKFDVCPRQEKSIIQGIHYGTSRVLLRAKYALIKVKMFEKAYLNQFRYKK